MTQETAMKILKELHDNSLFSNRIALETLIPELADSKDEKIRKALIRFHKSTIDVDGIKGADIIAWLEKQGEQKPTSDIKYEVKNGDSLSANGKPFDYEHATITQKDFAPKQELKFKIGDFIVYDYCMGRVVEITNDAYLLDIGQGIPFSCEDNMHLWTIQDAKDGDVLISQYGNPFIYNGNYNSLNIGAYCGIPCFDNFKVAEEKCHWTENVDIKPSNKEQCDKLFKAMKEAGYEWDADKKELKKLTQSVTKKSDKVWSYEDEANLNNIIMLCNNCIEGSETTWIPSQATKIKHLIETIKERGLSQQKPTEWSDEDEEMLQSCTGAIWAADSCLYEEKQEMEVWLKSLKERIGG